MIPSEPAGGWAFSVYPSSSAGLHQLHGDRPGFDRILVPHQVHMVTARIDEAHALRVDVRGA